MSESRPVSAAGLFQKLRWRLLQNTWRTTGGRSLVRPLTIVASSIIVWLFVFTVSFLGFHFLRVYLPLDEQIVGVFLGWLFLSLGVLLVFSTGLILYGSLFTAPETAFLLSKPVPDDQVFAYKLQGAIGFSSWAFLLLGFPLLLAYGMVAHVSWFFYLVLPLFFLGFILLPGSLGALACLLVVNFVPRRRRELVVGLILLLVSLTAWGIYRAIEYDAAQKQNIEAMTETASTLLGRIAFARSVWVPTAWVARGLQASGRGELLATGWYLALIWSNGLFLYLLATWCATFLYRRGFNLLTTGGDLRRKHGGLWMDRLLERLIPFVHPGTRLLIVKDFRTFRRDPQQWAQVLLFSGLLLLYFTNIRRMFLRDIEPAFQNTLSFLNLAVIALLLCTWTGRFIFPLLSLEGRKFWVLGLVPLRREQILWGKFGFSTASGLLLSVSLILTSDLMLGMPWDVLVIHGLTVAVLAAGLSGLSVGLGACMPSFRETDPSKIAVGFGGTVNLIVGLLFLLLTLAFMAGPWHLFMALAVASGGPPSTWMLPFVVVGVGGGLVLGSLAVLLPLRAGVKALEEMEF
jgi:ABC-2 type transport system permease protein